MSESVDSLFENAIERYKAGEDPQKLIPVFKDLCDRVPKTPLFGFVYPGCTYLQINPIKLIKRLKKASN